MLRFFVLLVWILGLVSGATWTASNAPNGQWRGMAMSTSGQQVVAQIQGGGIYYSSDYGATWTISNAPSATWIYMGGSDTGQYLVSSPYGGYVHYSQDYGHTWTVSNTGATGWHGSAMSGNGQYALASVNNGYIWYSSDRGQTFTQSSSGSDSWYDVGMDYTGQFAVAFSPGHGCCYSSDYGVTWTCTTTGVGVSTGRLIMGRGGGGVLFLDYSDSSMYRSTDYGHTFTQLTAAPTAQWYAGACDGTCTRILAAGQPGFTYLSLDAGATWTVNNAASHTLTPMGWSADGVHAAVGDFGGAIYYSSDVVPAASTSQTVPWPLTMAAQHQEKWMMDNELQPSVQQWVLGYSVESCTTTCGRVAGQCQLQDLSNIITHEAFYAMVSSSIVLGQTGSITADTFCNMGVNVFPFAGAPAALSYQSGSSLQTYCTYPTSVAALTATCDTVYSSPPSQRFCSCSIVQPQSSPTSQPSVQPASRPSGQPSAQPTTQPSSQPSSATTAQPSGQPSAQPSSQPSSQPSTQPASSPSAQPSVQPASSPSAQPSAQPSSSQLLAIHASPTYKVRNGFAFAAVGTGGLARTWGEAPYGGDSSAVSSCLLHDVSYIIHARFAFAAVEVNGSATVWGVPAARAGFALSGASSRAVIGVVANEAAFAGIDAVTGAVMAFGSKHYGGNVLDDAYCNGYSVQLSFGVRSITPSAGAFAAIKADNTLLCWGNKHAGADVSSSYLASLHGVRLVVATRAAFAALLSTGRVAAWGDAVTGGDTSAVAGQLTEVIHVTASLTCFVAFKKNTGVVVWGYGKYGGDASAVAAALSSHVVYVAHTNTAMAAVKTDGTVVAWGTAGDGGDSSAAQAALHSIVSVVGNAGAFAALTRIGAVVTWGKVAYGGVVPGDKTTALDIGVVSIYHTDRAFAALKSNGGALVVWGQAGHGGSPSAAVETLLTSGVHTVCANDAAFSAIKTDGSVVAWGHVVSVPVEGVQFTSSSFVAGAVCA